MTGVLIKRGDEGTDTHRGKTSEVTDRKQPSVSRGEAPEKINPANTLILGSQPPEL